MPVPQDPQAFADKLARAGETGRFWRINALEMLWNGCGYDARPGFWDTSVPLRERAPAVQSQIVRTAGRRLVSLVFGERAFPKVKAEGTAFGVTLSEPDRDALQALVDELIRVVSLKRRMREVLTDGLRAGTTLAVQSIRAGYPSVDLIPAKWCTPSFEDDGRTVKRLVVEYKFPREGAWYVHRRVIEAPRDVTYKPIKVQSLEHAPIDWTTAVIEHDIPCAFVPVVWHRNMAEAIETSTDIDGHALGEGLEDEIGALDLELSQLYRNALYNGDPQMVRIGLDAARADLPQGRTASAQSSENRGPRFQVASEPAIKKSVTNAWDLPTGGDAKFVESTGAGAQIINGAVTELRRVIVDAMGVVIADPAQFGTGDLSARALTLLMAPMLATADDLRVEYGETLLAILDQLLRLCAMTPGRINLATLEAARPALDRLFARSATGGTVWMRAPLSLKWGEFFEPSWTELSAALDVARKANGDQPVLTLDESRALLAQVLDVEVDATKVKEEQRAWVDTTAAVLNGTSADAATTAAVEGAAAVADTALNGAQVTSLVAIGEKVAAGLIPLAFARVAIRKAFPTFSESDINEALAGMSPGAPVTPENQTP